MSARPSISHLRAGIALLGGLGLVAGGLASGVAYLLLALMGSEVLFPLSSVAAVASLMALGLGLGFPLLWHGLQAWRGTPDSSFRPPRALVLTLVFVGAVAAGQGVLSAGVAPRFLFPLWNVLAGALPAMAVLAFVGRRLGQAIQRREVLGLMASGVLIGGLASILLVGLIALVLIFLMVVLVALMPGGLELLQSLTYRLQDPAWLQEPNNVMSLIFNPAALAGMLLLVAVVGPLVEELLKPVGLLFISRRPGRAEAFLGGLVGASGFALAEGMFNSAANLEAWLFVVLMRVGTSLMHCLAGGLVGLGWHYLRTVRRPWRAMGLYLSAVTLHGVWNVAALGIGGLALAGNLLGETMVNLGIVLLFGVIGTLTLIYAASLFGLTRRLQADLVHGTGLVSAEPSNGPR